MAIYWRYSLFSPFVIVTVSNINLFASTLLTTAEALQSTPRMIRRAVPHCSQTYFSPQREMQLRSKSHWRQNVAFSHSSVKDNSSKEKPLKSSSLNDIILLVFPLMLVDISNQWSRFSICYLVDFPKSSESQTPAIRKPYNSMNIDIGFTETQCGQLASTAFTVLFALSSLIAGNLADKYDRKLLTLTSCSVWALTTLAQSVAHSYEKVLAARFVMGGACALPAQLLILL